MCFRRKASGASAAAAVAAWAHTQTHPAAHTHPSILTPRPTVVTPLHSAYPRTPSPLLAPLLRPPSLAFSHAAAMFDHGFVVSLFLLSFTLLRASLSALVVLYPSFKTYKAIESKQIRRSHEMLVYCTKPAYMPPEHASEPQTRSTPSAAIHTDSASRHTGSLLPSARAHTSALVWLVLAVLLYVGCITAFLHSANEFLSSLVGSDGILSSLFGLVFKLTPLLLGPERLYNLVVRPVYAASEESVDAVVDPLRSEATKIKSMASSAMPEVSSGGVPVAQEKASEIASVLQADIVNTATEIAHVVQSKSQELVGVSLENLNPSSMVHLLDTIIARFESLRDSSANTASSQWKTHGPWITRQSSKATLKAKQLYQTHAPVVQSKIVDTYSRTVKPKIDPQVAKVRSLYTEKLSPFVNGQIERVHGVWVERGGPVRTMYHERLAPFYLDTLRPFVVHSLWPAVVETALDLFHRLRDMVYPPSEAGRAARAHSRKLRRDAVAESKTSWKHRSASHKKHNKRAETTVDDSNACATTTTSTAAPGGPIDESSSSTSVPASTLTNRKHKATSGSAAAEVQVQPKAAPSAPADEGEGAPVPAPIAVMLEEQDKAPLPSATKDQSAAGVEDDKQLPKKHTHHAHHHARKHSTGGGALGDKLEPEDRAELQRQQDWINEQNIAKPIQ